MNIQQFKYVLAVVDSKNYEDAADRCFVTQSTLSTMIVRFEDEIGIKIFNRKTKPVSVTKEGQQIVDRLRVVVNEIESLDGVIKELKGEISGDVKIAVIPTIAPYLLPLFLSDFANKYPKLNITIKEITTSEIEEGLLKRTIDIGIMALPITNKNLKAIELYKEPFVIYDCSETTKTNEISIKNLNSSKLWLLQEGHCMRTQVDKICKLTTKNKDANFTFESASMASLLNFTKLNKGITIIPYLALSSIGKEEQENIVNFDKTKPVRSVGLVTNQFYAKKQLITILQKSIQKITENLIPVYSSYEVINP